MGQEYRQAQESEVAGKAVASKGSPDKAANLASVAALEAPPLEVGLGVGEARQERT